MSLLVHVRSEARKRLNFQFDQDGCFLSRQNTGLLTMTLGLGWWRRKTRTLCTGVEPGTMTCQHWHGGWL